MATGYNATNYAKSIDPSSANIVDPGVLGGKVRVIQDTTIAQVLATGDYFLIGKQLPTGAQIVDVIVAATALTGSGNFIMLGDEGDTDRYLTTVTTSAAKMYVGMNAVAGVNYQVTGTTDNKIRVTSGGTAGAAPLSGGVIKVAVFYTME